MRGATLFVALVLTGGALGCDSGRGQAGVSRAALRAVESCEDLEGVLRDAAISEMRAQVMENYRSALDGSYGCWGRDYDGDGAWESDDAFNGAIDGDADPDVAPPGEAEDEGAEEFSTTNTQEVGVDEADFIKNDGSYIYIVSGREFLIIDAWPAAMTEVVARVELEGQPRLLYVHEDHAVIYADVFDESAGSSGDCYYDEYRGDSVCGASQRGTRMSIFDITDREHPVLERQIEMTGLYVNSRRIENNVHTVMTYPEIGFPSLRYWPESFDLCVEHNPASLWNAFSQVIQENIRIINETPLEGWVPSMTDTVFDEEGRPATSTDLLGDCDGFYEAVGARGRSFLSVMSFDLLEPGGDLNGTSVVGDQGVVYASRANLYVASRQYDSGEGSWYFSDDSGYDEATTVHQFSFDLDEPTTTYEASGVVPGRVLNQFALSEHNGYLRMATTVGYLPSPDCSNNIFVLEPDEGELEVVGEVTGIAPSEDIRSARFSGDRGFIVTFKKTDPLFAIDLSDPYNPRIEGELHIPGFSTYMHMMDSEHLLAIGFDAQDEGSFAWFQGVQLQIFDVSDMTNPERIHLEVIGTRGTTSEATGNHLAFNYFRQADLLAIPMAICEGGHDGSYGDEMTFNGLLVYDVTVDEGFSERGRVSHGEPPAGFSCSNWWTTSNSHVKRSVIMDDFVFSVADDQIVVAHLEDLGVPVASVALPLLAD